MKTDRLTKPQPHGSPEHRTRPQPLSKRRATLSAQAFEVNANACFAGLLTHAPQVQLAVLRDHGYTAPRRRLGPDCATDSLGTARHIEPP